MRRRQRDKAAVHYAAYRGLHEAKQAREEARRSVPLLSTLQPEGERGCLA